MIKPTGNYQSELYVHRKEANQVNELLVEHDDQQQPKYRLISIIGPPGIGKSWFLRYLLENFNQSNDYMPFLLDLSGGTLKSANERRQWLQNQTKEASETYVQNFNSFHFNFAVSFNVMFREFVKTLCDCDPTPKPILFVDGFDEIIDSDEIKVWQDILTVFWEGGCTGIIMARRDNQKLTHPILAWNDTPIQLTPFDEEQQHEQIRKRAGEEADEIIEQIEPFIAGNPFINTELYKCIHEKKVIKHSDIQFVIDRFFERANLLQTSEATDLVKRLVTKLPDNWRFVDLYSLRPRIRMESKEMEDLFTAGIIQPISGTLRYTIDAGLYSLIKTLDKLENDSA